MAKARKRPLILGIGFSPRKHGNSDILLNWAMQGAKAAGARTQKIFIRDFKIKPCQHCRKCHETGICNQKDDFMKVAAKINSADCLVIASPVYFLSVPAHAKAMIDRYQFFWHRKYALGIRPSRENRPALLLMTAGSERKDIFRCTRAPISAMLYTAGFKIIQELGVNNVDEKGEVMSVKGKEMKVMEAGKKLGNSLP